MCLDTPAPQMGTDPAAHLLQDGPRLPVEDDGAGVPQARRRPPGGWSARAPGGPGPRHGVCGDADAEPPVQHQGAGTAPQTGGRFEIRGL